MSKLPGVPSTFTVKGYTYTKGGKRVTVRQHERRHAPGTGQDAGSKPRRGFCAHCGQEVSVRKDGTAWSHILRIGPCPGSHKPVVG